MLADHPLRYELANELHARPFPALDVPCTAVYLAVKQADQAVSRDRQADMDHLIALLDRYGAPHPQPGATHYSGQIGRHILRWESHTEFVTYSAFANTLSERAFDPADFEVFPEDWLAAAPGVRVAAVHIRVQQAPDRDRIEQHLNDWFVADSVAVSRALDDAATIAADFSLDTAGNTRFAVFVNPGTGRRRVGRIVQRLAEVEIYKSLSMLGFARVKQLSAQLGEMDVKLTGLMDHMGDDTTAADVTLAGLLSTSAEMERMVAHNAFRFGATEAYRNIVHQRIGVLREQRFEGRQTFNEFMMRRYAPAMRTVQSTKERLAALADRAMRAGELLRTRVDVERSAQNQKLLESMNRRADMQLKLQKTVEGLSVVAISYYAVSLASYAAYPLTDLLGVSKGELTAALTLPVVAVVWWMIRRVQKKMH
ncbi:hypothetical protein TG4357_02750 [Thalassovita gelatinovora]|uniref:DUF3422 domain-containing protein n=1 Tax=Thalassovita gelatinovora TaxID=53501 RepID=A0A0P1FG48_THAGE|nr:DUF3422 domain-containing protein [Thalassovita gelatinovora]QIZ79870.1 DUF3422 domain-containing protein [Thalassovita gelatinovora]CUH66975.1 hypothetical protein TG4357_02750 [Thalassovita gelatinovora]SEQ46072.1 Uncharacterized membrane-anchored protein [Thalassovita gelatinovora]